MSTSESSSDGEDSVKFKEAAVTYNPTVYGSKIVSELQQRHTLPSLRQQEKVDENDLDITPEFRMHVARKLANVLDRSVEIVDQEYKQETHEEKGSENDFRLFSTSVPSENKETLRTSVKRTKFPESDSSYSSSDEERFQTCAVSADYIIAQSKIKMPLCSAGEEKELCSSTENASSLAGGCDLKSNYQKVERNISTECTDLVETKHKKHKKRKRKKEF